MGEGRFRGFSKKYIGGVSGVGPVLAEGAARGHSSTKSVAGWHNCGCEVVWDLRCKIYIFENLIMKNIWGRRHGVEFLLGWLLGFVGRRVGGLLSRVWGNVGGAAVPVGGSAVGM